MPAINQKNILFSIKQQSVDCLVVRAIEGNEAICSWVAGTDFEASQISSDGSNDYRHVIGTPIPRGGLALKNTNNETFVVISFNTLPDNIKPRVKQILADL